MPKDVDGARAPAKQKNKAGDRQRDQEVGSQEGGYTMNGALAGRPKSADTLAGSSRALQRLADVAHYFQTSASLTDDVEEIEKACKGEIGKDKEIRRLQDVVATLTHTKTEETENLRLENEKLKEREALCENERAKCKALQAEVEARLATHKAKMEEEMNSKLREQKSRSQKQIDNRKTEIENNSKKQLQTLEDQIKELSAAKVELEGQLSEAKEKLEKKKTRHARLEKILEEENGKLRSELTYVKSEIPIKTEPVQQYAERFQQVHSEIRNISARYFQALPEKAINNPEAVRHELRSLNAAFESMPLWQTEVADFMRIRAVQHVISCHLCNELWQPFGPQSLSTSNRYLGDFLETVSKSLSRLEGRCESAWRVLTLRGIAGLEDTSRQSSLASDTTHGILKSLRPLIIPSQMAELEKDLMNTIGASIALWQDAQRIQARLVVQYFPSSEDSKKWNAEDFNDVHAQTQGNADINQAESLCMFPAIVEMIPGGESVIVQGAALFPSSNVWIQGALEKQIHEDELAKAVIDARSRVSARRLSVAVGAKSPTSS